MSDKCRACQAEIIWIRTKNGNTMPVNAEPIWVKLQTGGDTFVPFDSKSVKPRLITIIRESIIAP